MTYTTTSTMLFCLLLAIPVVGWLYWCKLADERERAQQLAWDLDLWKTSGMSYFHRYPRFDWPDGIGEGGVLELGYTLATIEEALENSEALAQGVNPAKLSSDDRYRIRTQLRGHDDPGWNPGVTDPRDYAAVSARLAQRRIDRRREAQSLIAQCEQLVRNGDARWIGGDCCVLCGTEDTGRFPDAGDVCIDCLDSAVTVVGDPNSCDRCGSTTNEDPFLCDRCADDGPPRALIVDDIYRKPLFRPETPGYCNHCDSRLRATEDGSSLCSACSALAERWYTKPLDAGFDHTSVGWWALCDKHPHEALVAIGHYNDRDYIDHWTHSWIPLGEADELMRRDYSDEAYHVVYLPPEQGPREGSRAPAFRSDFAPSGTPDYDDIPF